MPLNFIKPRSQNSGLCLSPEQNFQGHLEEILGPVWDKTKALASPLWEIQIFWTKARFYELVRRWGNVFF